MGTIGTLAPAQASSGSGFSNLLILALPILLLVWMFWTTRSRQKSMRQFQASINVGDKVVTSSGMYGTIQHLDAESAYIEVAEGITVRFDRRAVAMKQTDRVAADPAGPTNQPGQ